MNKTSRTKLYKKYHLNPKKANPGDLIVKSRQVAQKHKAVKMGDQPSMAGWRPVKTGFAYPKAGAGSGVGRIQKATMPQFNPSTPKTNASNPSPMAKSHKMMCKTCGEKHGMSVKHKKNWIANAIKKPGALHRQLGVKSGNKIPAGKLASATKKGGKLGQRARLAETLKGFRHG